MNKQKKEISRRDFILSIIGAAGFSFIAGSYWNSVKVNNALKKIGEPILPEHLKNLYSEIAKEMSVIGKNYLENKSELITSSQILNKLNEALSSQKLSTEMLYDFEIRIQEQILSDHRKQAYVNIDNWIITTTEANLCALLYINSKS